MRIVAGSASYTLPESVAVNDGDTSFRVSVENGVLLEAHKPESGSINATGILFGTSHLNAEELEQAILAKLQGELHLYRHDDSTAYARVLLKSVSIDTYRGRFNGRVSSVSFKFDSMDGYRYGAVTSVSAEIDNADEAVVLNNPGAIPAYATISFEADAESTVVGDFVACGGKKVTISESITVGIGETLVVTDKSASLAGSDVTRKLSTASLVSPILLAPGDNTISIYGLGKYGEITMSMTPRWPG